MLLHTAGDSDSKRANRALDTALDSVYDPQAQTITLSTDTLLASTRDPQAEEARAQQMTEVDGQVSSQHPLLVARRILYPAVLRAGLILRSCVQYLTPDERFALMVANSGGADDAEALKGLSLNA